MEISEYDNISNYNIWFNKRKSYKNNKNLNKNKKTEYKINSSQIEYIINNKPKTNIFNWK